MLQVIKMGLQLQTRGITPISVSILMLDASSKQLNKINNILNLGNNKQLKILSNNNSKLNFKTLSQILWGSKKILQILRLKIQA